MKYARSGGFSSIILVDVRNLVSRFTKAQLDLFVSTKTREFDKKYQKLKAGRANIVPELSNTDDMLKPLYVFIDQGDLDTMMIPNVVMEPVIEQDVIRICVSCVKDTSVGKRNCKQKVNQVGGGGASNNQDDEDTTNPMDDYVFLSLKSILEGFNERLVLLVSQKRAMEMKNLSLLEQYIRGHRYHPVSDSVLQKKKQILQTIRRLNKRTSLKIIPIYAMTHDKHRDWLLL
jgi:hypothetical protein